ncbi:hypothetical protein PUNSTDRAFT_136406 [Punctularia strigosozonata HHB-11173 SS5]|uniref:uncharacterized protein n=1 Tax=Punctularia strigosozonata (strain HHB-11173) TaxID=741275 RepID=UPI0004416DC0|nr:uncharacterized protein PUNSTDRAFT_136406 [Punctularia strigosozonata HHB-11173 SS5]EIN06553.1 hypothetical protein PUNSTDRAFT_136406 [Punctularia strigosozonata HHB-11173 SS5]
MTIAGSNTNEFAYGELSGAVYFTSGTVTSITAVTISDAPSSMDWLSEGNISGSSIGGAPTATPATVGTTTPIVGATSMATSSMTHPSPVHVDDKGHAPHSIQAGAIAGGVMGGFVIVLTLLVLIRRYRKRRLQPTLSREIIDAWGGGGFPLLLYVTTVIGLAFINGANARSLSMLQRPVANHVGAQGQDRVLIEALQQAVDWHLSAVRAIADREAPPPPPYQETATRS